MQNNTVFLSNELDITNLLNQVLDDKVDLSHLILKMKDFTKFNLHVSGDKYNQTITPSVMKGFLELQSAIYKTYSLIRYNDEVPNKLTQDDRNDLEIEVKVINGSSGFEVDFTKLFEILIDKTVARMEGKHVMVLLLTAMLLYAGHSGYQTYIEHQTEIRKLELEQKSDEQERQERLRTIEMLTQPNKEAVKAVEKATVAYPEVKVIRNDSRRVTQAFVKSVRDADKVELQNAVSFTGPAAQEISMSSRSAWESVRLDGMYQIVHVDSSNAAQRKIKVKRVDNGNEFVATLENDTLDQKNLTKIQDAEWKYAHVFLNIRALSLNGKVKNAEIIGAVKETTV